MDPEHYVEDRADAAPDVRAGRLQARQHRAAGRGNAPMIERALEVVLLVGTLLATVLMLVRVLLRVSST